MSKNTRSVLELLIRQLSVTIPLTLLLAFGYQNGWSSSDFKTVIVTAVALLGSDVLQKKMIGQTEETT